MTPTPEKNTCTCAEKSCKENCQEQHTHKGFWCEKCHPERYEKSPEKNSWQIELAKLLDQFHHESGKYSNAGKIVVFVEKLVSQARAEERSQTRERIGDWVDKMVELGEFSHENWSSEDEVIASIMSYIEGNHLKNTPQ